MTAFGKNFWSVNEITDIAGVVRSGYHKKYWCGTFIIGTDTMIINEDNKVKYLVVGDDSQASQKILTDCFSNALKISQYKIEDFMKILEIIYDLGIL